MTELFAQVATLPPLALGVLGLAGGFGLGLVHFASLGRVLALYASGAPAWKALALTLGRFGLLALVLAGLAALGAVPLLAGAVGILIARGVILRRVKGQP